MTRTIVLATGNVGKVREISELLADMDVEVVPQSAFGIHSPPEDGDSFAANALLKARFAAARTGLPAIADDSGLAVAALGGAPGVHSARYAGPGASDAQNIDKLLRALRGLPDELRTAAFHCCACYVTPDDVAADDSAGGAPPDSPLNAHRLLAEGRWAGRILHARQGKAGFGYDPIFFDPQHACTAAEMSAAEKNARSHRGKAFRALADKLRLL